jgi:hypothetical protein
VLFLEISGSEKHTFIFLPPGPHELLLAADGHALPQVHRLRLFDPKWVGGGPYWARGVSGEWFRGGGPASGSTIGPSQLVATR